MGAIINNSVKMEKGYKLAALWNQQKKFIIASQKQALGEKGAVNSDIAKMSDERKAKAKAKAKQVKLARRKNK
ncbi:MAG: hypothetical protein J0647_02060 [Campylobacteraceae bacterium]|nr:hypothetical protein [Campylobacteraceae bacterium]